MHAPEIDVIKGTIDWLLLNYMEHDECICMALDRSPYRQNYPKTDEDE